MVARIVYTPSSKNLGALSAAAVRRGKCAFREVLSQILRDLVAVNGVGGAARPFRRARTLLSARSVMKPVLVLYATREGHTRRVAHHVADTLSANDLAAEVHDVGELREPFSLEPYAGVILAASVHGGRHARKIAAFAARHRTQLAEMPSGFLSVSLSEAGAEDVHASAEQRARAAEGVGQMFERFFAKTGWRPRLAEPVAGALPYTQYNPLKRFVMKRIVKSMGGPTDTSRDYEFTNFAALEEWVERFVASLDAGARSAAGAAPSQPHAGGGERAEPREARS
jgi:menaquinone-dependent protoporphyrinogen oxidase